MSYYTLKNERLEVTFSHPETYKGTRFDHMGMIKSVVLDEKDTFYAKESLIEGEGSGGEGFYNEFGIEEPIGYDDATIGESFPKIGVGALLKKTNEPYNFFQHYTFDPFDYTVTPSAHTITFSSDHSNIRGYALTYTKEVSIHTHQMTITYTLHNTGTKCIQTTEYCHNFVAINDLPIGPDYELLFSYPLVVANSLGDFQIRENKITFPNPIQEVIYCKFKDLPSTPSQFFEVLHVPSGVGFRETSLFPLERVALWGMPHVISPESFVTIHIQPGETQTWQRVYTFFN